LKYLPFSKLLMFCVFSATPIFLTGYISQEMHTPVNPGMCEIREEITQRLLIIKRKEIIEYLLNLIISD
jgi:hypothetical protein